jgi:hypothetical protein
MATFDSRRKKLRPADMSHTFLSFGLGARF